MKLRCKIGFLFVFLFVSFALNGQEFYKSVNQISPKANSLNYKLTGKRHYFETSFKGTPYMYDEWQRGSVLLENGDSYDSLYLNLNTLAEELIWYNIRTGNLVDLDKFIIDEFTLYDKQNNIKLFKKIYSDKYHKGEHYYHILHDGEIKLWLWYRTIVVVTSVYKDVWGNMLNSEYDSQNEFFVVLPDSSVVRIKNNRKSLIQLFPEHKRVVRRLLVRNGIDFRDISISDMAKAVELIDQEIFSN